MSRLTFIDATPAKVKAISNMLHNTHVEDPILLRSEDLIDTISNNKPISNIIFWVINGKEKYINAYEQISLIKDKIIILSFTSNERALIKVSLDYADEILQTPYDIVNLKKVISNAKKVNETKRHLLELEKKLINCDSFKKGKEEIKITYAGLKHLGRYYLLIGQFYEIHNLPAKALNAYTKGLEVSHLHQGCVFGVLNLLYLNKHYDKAIDLFFILLEKFDIKDMDFEIGTKSILASKDFHSLNLVLKYAKQKTDNKAPFYKLIGTAFFVFLKYAPDKVDFDNFKDYLVCIRSSVAHYPTTFLDIANNLYSSGNEKHIKLVLESFLKDETHCDEYIKISFYKVLIESTSISNVAERLDQVLSLKRIPELYKRNIRMYYYRKKVIENCTSILEVLDTHHILEEQDS